MAVRTPSQLAWRRRVEAGIRCAAPVLDLVLAVGDRVSRVAGRGDAEPEPPRRLSGAAARGALRPGADRS
ncbi:MAG TPA: hypothetical protein VN213_02125 [Solirubrobacteraceae bacterium]|nr:hypothetical protein [Solirubrobacteraceae bacterium]